MPQWSAARFAVPARESVRTATDPSFVIRREAQLLISYADSPIVGPDGGGRAPDASGLTRQAVSDPMRLYTLLGPDHTTLLHAGNAGGADDVAGPGSGRRCRGAGRARADGRLPGRGTGRGRGSVLPLIRDTDGDFARNLRCL